jgi:D-amino-acid oxidase
VAKVVGLVTVGGRRKVLVIGAGVVGLTTALCAKRAGHDVVVAAEQFAPDMTSALAGALWEWPPAICGHHRDESSLERAKAWCMTSYRTFHWLARDPRTGVHIRPAVFYFRRPVERIPFEYRKMQELQEHVYRFRRDPALAEENGINPDAGIQDAYTFLAPMIDTDIYMNWLLGQVTDAGCRVMRTRIEGDLMDCERKLLDFFDVDIIVNCSGLGSIELTGEPMYPLRSTLIHAHNDGRDMPRITSAHCIGHSRSFGGQDIVFIVPRGKDHLVLGGLVESNKWGTNLTIENYPPIADMLIRCQEFLPVLRDVRLVADGTVRAGLHPARPRGVRLEHEPGTRILHNIGHGESGVTFSWGCAEEIVALLAELPRRAGLVRAG